MGRALALQALFSCLSIAGLRVLLMIKKAIPGNELILQNVGAPIMEILDTTGFSDLFTIADRVLQ